MIGMDLKDLNKEKAKEMEVRPNKKYSCYKGILVGLIVVFAGYFGFSSGKNTVSQIENNKYAEEISYKKSHEEILRKIPNASPKKREELIKLLGEIERKRKMGQ